MAPPHSSPPEPEALDQLLLRAASDKCDEASLRRLAAALSRVDAGLTPEQRARAAELAGGETLAAVAARLLEAVDAQRISHEALLHAAARDETLGPQHYLQVRQVLAAKACAPFDNPELRHFLAPGSGEAAAGPSLADQARARFARWLSGRRQAGAVYTDEQMNCLRRMRDCVAAGGRLDRDRLIAEDLLRPAYRAFGEQLWALIGELNAALRG
ncbi:MAG TPA: hypothetical protein VFA75_21630 [Nevskia sp.]|nr:hypothetical protein [Nevskia sp.]